MDILRPIIKNLTYNFYLKRDGLDVKNALSSLIQSQYFSTEQLKELQLDLLRQLLIYCRGHNSFYQKRFHELGFDPGDIHDLSQLSALPVLTKDDIREAGGNLFSEGYTRENTVAKRTGGSTGVPLHVHLNFDAASLKMAATIRHNAWANFVPGTRLAAVWGDTDRPMPIKERIRNLLTNRAFYLDTLKFDEEHIEKFIRLIKSRKPRVLMGHAHSIFKLAEYIRDNKKGDFRFDGIITTAMVLSPGERKVIEDVFSSAVFDRYGCEELSIIASECEAHQGLHLFAEGLYVELEGADRKSPCKLIITDLVNYAMPLIRYEIGDFAVMQNGQCPCGRTLPRLKEVSGRTADFLYTPEKTPVFGISILDTFVIHIPGFKQVQIVQDAYDHLLFKIVKDDMFSEESLNRLRQNVAEIFGPKMHYDIEFVDRIEQTESGKYRFSICDIPVNEKKERPH